MLPHLPPGGDPPETPVHHWRFFVCGITCLTGSPISKLSRNYPPPLLLLFLSFLEKVGDPGRAGSRDPCRGERFQLDHLFAR
jgi:hypothetical protein